MPTSDSGHWRAGLAMLVEQRAAGGSAQQRAGQQVAVSPAEVQAERPRSAQRMQQRDRARRTPSAAAPAAAQSAGGGHRRPMPPRTRHPPSRRRCRPPPAAVARGRSSQTVGAWGLAASQLCLSSHSHLRHGCKPQCAKRQLQVTVINVAVHGY